MNPDLTFFQTSETFDRDGYERWLAELGPGDPVGILWAILPPEHGVVVARVDGGDLLVRVGSGATLTFFDFGSVRQGHRDGAAQLATARDLECELAKRCEYLAAIRVAPLATFSNRALAGMTAELAHEARLVDEYAAEARYLAGFERTRHLMRWALGHPRLNGAHTVVDAAPAMVRFFAVTIERRTPESARRAEVLVAATIGASAAAAALDESRAASRARAATFAVVAIDELWPDDDDPETAKRIDVIGLKVDGHVELTWRDKPPRRP